MLAFCLHAEEREFKDSVEPSLSTTIIGMIGGDSSQPVHRTMADDAQCTQQHSAAWTSIPTTQVGR